MNRNDLIRHLEAHGCVFWREGAKHTIYHNPNKGTFSSVPRHRTLKKYLAFKICDDLGIPKP
ncbi:MAG: type II toxin-antitoxin system HicA family toxin [Acidobacteria bacterium]|nr:type II toxin-antitoxin system HicA family toxin [Acidobacteriota bacterium]